MSDFKGTNVTEAEMMKFTDRHRAERVVDGMHAVSNFRLFDVAETAEGTFEITVDRDWIESAKESNEFRAERIEALIDVTERAFAYGAIEGSRG